MTISKLWMVVLIAGGCGVEPGTDTTDQSVTVTPLAHNGSVTKITVNGSFADFLLVDGDVNGILTASKDAVANTSAIDFSYAFLDPNDSNIAILIQGAGAIPNSSFTVSLSAAHLVVTTTFPVNHCEIDLTTGIATCTVAPASSFNLTWAQDGFGSLTQKESFVQVEGPVTTKFKGNFQSRTARVNGTWDGHTAVNQPADLSQTQNNTIIREITLAP